MGSRIYLRQTSYGREREHEFECLADAVNYLSRLYPDTDWTDIVHIPDLSDRLHDGWSVDWSRTSVAT